MPLYNSMDSQCYVMVLFDTTLLLLVVWTVVSLLNVDVVVDLVVDEFLAETSGGVGDGGGGVFGLGK